MHALIAAFTFFHTDLLSVTGFKKTDGNKINILDKIGVEYDLFGANLLNDTDSSKMAEIKNDNRGAAAIKRRIIEKWIRGGGMTPVSWGTLAEVVEDIGFPDLAQDIRDGAQFQ